jgi:hypothetical protein
VTRWDGIHDNVKSVLDIAPVAQMLVREPKGDEEEEEQEKSDEEDDESEDNVANAISDDDAITDDDDEIALKASSKLTHGEKVIKYSPSKDAFTAGAHLEAALNLPRQLTKLTQASQKPTLNIGILLTRALVASAEAPLKVLKWTKTVQTKNAEQT